MVMTTKQKTMMSPEIIKVQLRKYLCRIIFHILILFKLILCFVKGTYQYNFLFEEAFDIPLDMMYQMWNVILTITYFEKKTYMKNVCFPSVLIW